MRTRSFWIPSVVGVTGWVVLAFAANNWALRLAWIPGVLLVVFLAGRARGFARPAIGLLLAAGLVTLTFEGGLFFLPAALALMAIPKQHTTPTSGPRRATLASP